MTRLKIGTPEQRKEYTRLRAIARKRILRMEQAGFGDDPILNQKKQLLVLLADVRREPELKARIFDLKTFIYDSPTKLSEYREYRADELAKIRYYAPFVSSKDVLHFWQDMEQSTRDKINYLIKYAQYMSRHKYADMVEQIRADYETWKVQQRG